MNEYADVLEFDVPPEHEEGTYAHAYAIWHTPYDFVLDFAVAIDDAADAPARLVARVRIPPGLVFALMQALNEKMTQYESDWGEIRTPRRERGEGA